MSTTSVSKGLVTKSALVAAAVVIGLSTPLIMMQQAHADKYDDQIGALRAQMEQYQSQAGDLNKQAQTYQAALDQLTAQKNAIIAQIDLSQQQYDQLQKQISDTEQKISDNKDALGAIIADMYVDGSISPLEMLASSKNIGDYVDQQQYRSSVQDNLSKTIEQINALKKKLESSKKNVEKVMDQQKGQKAELASKEAEQQQLVDKTKGDEAAYTQMASDAQSQMASIAAQQRAYLDSLNQQSSGGSFTSGMVGGLSIVSFNGNQGCSGGYPYCGGSLDYTTDKWKLYARECVSYAAWRIESFGKTVKPFNGEGMAYEWTYSAPKYSGAYAVNDPAPGDAVVLPITPGLAPVGHLMVVEGVSGDNVYVSQYNFGGTGEYSTMTISKSGSRVVYMRFR